MAKEGVEGFSLSIASIVNSFYGAVSPVAPLGRARLMGCAKHGDNYSFYLMWTRRWGKIVLQPQ